MSVKDGKVESKRYKASEFDWDLESTEICRKLFLDCVAHFGNLREMSVKAKYEHYRIKAIDSFFRNCVTFQSFLKHAKSMLKGGVTKDEVEAVKKDMRDFNITFGSDDEDESE